MIWHPHHPSSLQRTQSWLERYIFKRAPRAYNMNLTYFISAFWHGFYPGYVTNA